MWLVGMALAAEGDFLVVSLDDTPTYWPATVGVAGCFPAANDRRTCLRIVELDGTHLSLSISGEWEGEGATADMTVTRDEASDVAGGIQVVYAAVPVIRWSAEAEGAEVVAAWTSPAGPDARWIGDYRVSATRRVVVNTRMTGTAIDVEVVERGRALRSDRGFRAVSLREGELELPPGVPVVVVESQGVVLTATLCPVDAGEGC